MNWLNKLERKFGRYAIPQSYPLSDRRVYHRILCLYVCTEFAESSDTGTGVHSARTDLEDHFMGIDPAKRKYFYDCDHDAVLLFLGTALERTCGAFRGYNVYIFSESCLR